MEALNNLLLEFARRINQRHLSGLSETENEFLVEEFSKKYSVAYRNNDSTTDNVKLEQSINQEQLMSQIEDIAAELSCLSSNATFQSKYPYEAFKTQLRDLFAMHFKSDSRPVNVSDEQTVSRDITVSKIESLWFNLKYKLMKDNFDSYLIYIVKMKELINELKTQTILHDYSNGK